MLETIKEYLVSLGFKTDDSSLNAAQAAMKKAEGSVAKFANSSVKDFAKAATGVVTFVATANIALGKFMINLAQSDLATEMFARKMWMSKDAAKAYQSSIDALGVSINDLYLSPELMNKYLDLNREARDMAVPAEEYNKQMQGVRDITFQFQRLKLEGTYALQWIGYYLTKYLSGPMGDVKNWLTKINDTIQQKMPEWTKKVAEVASWFVRLGKAAWSIRSALGAVVGVLAGFKMISMLTNPLGLFVLGLTALILLVDDFNTYMSGGESAFPKLWAWLEKLKKSFVDSGYLKDFKGIIKDVVQWVKDLGAWFEKIGQSKTFRALIKDIKDILSNMVVVIKNTAGWFEELGKKLKDNGDLSKFAEDIGKLAESILGLVDAITALMGKLGKTGIGDAIQHNLINMLEIVDGLIKSITGGLEIITGLLSGDNKKTDKGLGDIEKGIMGAVVGPKKAGETFDSWQKTWGGFVDKNSAGSHGGELKKGDTGDGNNSAKSPFSEIVGDIKGFVLGLFGKSSAPKIGQTSYETNCNAGNPWSSFKNSIPGASDASTVDWSTLKKGFVAFMNSIPKEFGDISKGLFQTAKGYGDSGAIGGASAMSYLYPQTSTSSMSQISMKQNYYIYGATNPQSVAKTVDGITTASLTRHFQGGVR